MIMMNCCCGMVDRRKAFSLISSRDHCQRSSPSRISNTPRAGFEPAQNLSSGIVQRSCTVVITTNPFSVGRTAALHHKCSPKCSGKPPGYHPNLKVFLSQVENELFKTVETPLAYSDLSKEEWEAVSLAD